MADGTNKVGSAEAAKAPVHVGGIPAEHLGAEGITGVLGVLDEVLEGMGWQEGVASVDIGVRRNPVTGEAEVFAYNVKYISDEPRDNPFLN